MTYVVCHTISLTGVQSAPPSPWAAPAAAAASLRRFLVSAAWSLLSLRRLLLILSASAIDTMRERAPHPDIHLVEPVAVAPVPLRVGGGVSKTPIVLEAVWDRGVTVAANEARNERGAPQHVCHRANVEAGQARVAGRVIKHGHSRSLHDTVWRQLNGLKRAEIHQG